MRKEQHYQERAVKRLSAIAIALVVLGLLVWQFSLSGTIERIEALKTSAERIAAEKLSKSFFAPEPLIATGTSAANNRFPGDGVSINMTITGDIAATNVARAVNGNLPPLKENTTLDDIAALRLADMFAKQYFAHVSPASSSAETVADAVGYQYLALGENLALGTFAGDRAVVAAWMASPGHRANILSNHYSEIGVAVKKDMFQGSEVWIAVQVFGRPLSDCPRPNAQLANRIIDERATLTRQYADLQAAHAELDAMSGKEGNGEAYVEKANAYNDLVAQYNDGLTRIKTETADYNSQVEIFNKCIAAAKL